MVKHICLCMHMYNVYMTDMHSESVKICEESLSVVSRKETGTRQDQGEKESLVST